MSDDFYADPEICQAILMDYYRNPRCSGVCNPATHAAEGRNPACGDIVKITFQVENGNILQARTSGAGCAVSQAAASLLMERLEGRSTHTAQNVLAVLDQFLLAPPVDAPPFPHAEKLEKLSALSLILKNPARVECARISLKAARTALGQF